MIRPILLYGSPILRQTAQPVDLGDPNLPALIQDLWDTMYNADGVGLAAPQIGVSKQIFVVDARELQPPEEEPFHGVFINPRILTSAPECIPYEEGCLSIPHIREKIYRPNAIKMEFYDEDFRLTVKEYTGIVARVLQHEYDHLLGRLFIDYLSPIRKQLLRKKLRDIATGGVEAHYPIAHAH
ncbi:MAG: peptide deformylase [Bacteroidia bacterium]|nr:peptide deformylase [Bacteroidia bacterium]